MAVDLRPYKFKIYKNQPIRDDMVITLKLDGVMGIQTDKGWISRAGKPLYNIPKIEGIDVAEIFIKDFNTSISAVHTLEREQIQQEAIYSLFPNIDPRLLIEDKSLTIPKGAEGLIIRDDLNRIYYKVKIVDTMDIEVIDITPGTGKHKGRIGALITSRGKVGTGLKDADRERQDLIGKIIEVEYMELTYDGKFRHPRLIAIRDDKS